MVKGIGQRWPLGGRHRSPNGTTGAGYSTTASGLIRDRHLLTGEGDALPDGNLTAPESFQLAVYRAQTLINDQLGYRAPLSHQPKIFKDRIAI